MFLHQSQIPKFIGYGCRPVSLQLLVAVLPDAVQNVLKKSLATVHAGYPDDDFNLFIDDDSCRAYGRPEWSDEDVSNYEELLRLLLHLQQYHSCVDHEGPACITSQYQVCCCYTWIIAAKSLQELWTRPWPPWWWCRLPVPLDLHRARVLQLQCKLRRYEWPATLPTPEGSTLTQQRRMTQSDLHNVPSLMQWYGYVCHHYIAKMWGHIINANCNII